eukprot:jgi/Bigna1/74426/fgenesh1_pg.29_\
MTFILLLPLLVCCVAIVVLVVITSDKFLSGTVYPERLKGKVVIITGSASGIGEVVAKKLANHGAHVVMLDVSALGLKRVSNEITKKGGVASSYLCDVSDVKAVSSMAAKVKAEFPQGIDVLINNAGVVGEGKNLIDWSNEDLAKTLGINALGPLYMIKAAITLCHVFLKDMIKRDQGRIVNVASSAGSLLRVQGSSDSCEQFVKAWPWHVNTRMFNGVTKAFLRFKFHKKSARNVKEWE